MRNNMENVKGSREPSAHNDLDGKNLIEGSRSVVSLKSIPLELRKKEASKPIYLIRYE